MRFIKYVDEALKLLTVPVSMAIDNPLSPPSVAALYLTRRCNSRCSMCGFWKKDFDYEKELDTEEWFKVLEDLREMKVPFVSVGAEGEVFTRKDVLPVLRRIRQLGFDYTINTNGLYLPEKFVEEVDKLAPHRVIFGLDTADPDQYARIRGIPDGFSKVLESIRRLRRAGYEGVSIGAVILHSNLDQLLALAELALEEKVKALRFTAFSPVGFGMDWNREGLEYYYSPDFRKKLTTVIEELIRHKRKHRLIANSEEYLIGIIEYMQSGFRNLPVPCVIGYYNLQVLPNGNIPVCGFRGESAVAGNVRGDSIRDIWKSRAYQNERDKIKKGHCPTCWMSCYAENNLRFSLKTMIRTNADALKRSVGPYT